MRTEEIIREKPPPFINTFFLLFNPILLCGIAKIKYSVLSFVVAFCYLRIMKFCLLASKLNMSGPLSSAAAKDFTTTYSSIQRKK